MGNAVLKIQSEKSYWFVARGDMILGPYVLSQIHEQLEKGSLSPSEFCWKEGFGEWRPVASTNEFSELCEGKRFVAVAYPKLALPSHKSDESGNRRRANDKMTMLSLAPENRKIVQVNFAKTRIRRLSIYEWAFSMAFAMVCTFLGSKLTLDAVVQRITQLRQKQFIAGRVQHFGSTENFQAILPEYSVQPLLTAPGLNEGDYYAFGVQQGVLNKPVMSVTLYRSGDVVRSQEWKIDSKYNSNLWSPLAQGIDPIYHRPIKATVLVPTLPSNSVEPVLRGEPYLY